MFQLLSIIGFLAPLLSNSHMVLACDLVKDHHGSIQIPLLFTKLTILLNKRLLCILQTLIVLCCYSHACSFSALFLSLPRAAHILRGTGKTVNLIVAKQAAVYYGLTHLIHQPSPRYSRKHNPHR